MDLSKQTKTSNFLRQDASCLLLLFAFIFVLVAPIFLFGIPNGFDLPFHFQLTFSYFDSIQTGNIFPSWSAVSNYGFGDTAVRYYPPLAHYFLAFTQFVTGDWVITTWLNILCWMWLASLGAYLLAREWLSPVNALWVGILYAVAPYHLSQIYQYFLYSEFAAAAILPFCFLYLTRVCRDESLKNSIGLGVSFALLILCHIPTTIISTICLGIYAILIIDWKKFRAVTSKLFLSGLLALASTSFYWVKLVTESAYSNQSNARQFSGLYDYKLHFFPFYLSQPDLYLIKQLWLKDIVSTFTLLLILPLLALIIWKYKKSFFAKNKTLLALTVTAGFAFFMSSSLSFFVWSNVAFLQKLQFPFRWLTVASLLGVLGFVMIITQCKSSNNLAKISTKYLLLLFFVSLALFNITQIIIPSEALTRISFEETLRELPTAEGLEVTRTVWAKTEAFNQKEKVEAQNRDVKINLWTAEMREFEIETGEPTSAQIATFYYPYWQALVNDKQVEIAKSDNGTILIPIPAEKSKVQIVFAEPNFLRIFNFVSLLTWVILIAICGNYVKHKIYLLKTKPETTTINI